MMPVRLSVEPQRKEKGDILQQSWYNFRNTKWYGICVQKRVNDTHPAVQVMEE